jgi:hypothetical protein
MKFDDITALLKANPNDTDWGHVELDNVWTAYCKPFMQISMCYASTILLSLSIPIFDARFSRNATAPPIFPLGAN